MAVLKNWILLSEDFYKFADHRHGRVPRGGTGRRFEIEVLTKEERREAERRNQPVYPTSCPNCRRTGVREGWD